MASWRRPATQRAPGAAARGRSSAPSSTPSRIRAGRCRWRGHNRRIRATANSSSASTTRPSSIANTRCGAALSTAWTMSTSSPAASLRPGPTRCSRCAWPPTQPSFVRVDVFDYHLPEELIALRPAVPRDAARLLAVDPTSAEPLSDKAILDLPELLSLGDALVFNDTKVIPAELAGMRRRGEAAAHVSVTLIERVDAHRWRALARPAKRLKAGDRIAFGKGSNVCLLGGLDAAIEACGEEGEVTIAFDLAGAALDDAIKAQGAMPLPPYI